MDAQEFGPEHIPVVERSTEKRGKCTNCQTAPVTGRKRKYCDRHSSVASALWKRLHRRLWKAAGDKYWLSDWKNKSVEERRAYFRAYMQEYRRGLRRRNRARDFPVNTSLSGSPTQTFSQEKIPPTNLQLTLSRIQETLSPTAAPFGLFDFSLRRCS